MRGPKTPNTCVGALRGCGDPACLQNQGGLATGWFGLLRQLRLLRFVGLNQLWLRYPDQLKTESKAQSSEGSPSLYLGQLRVLALPTPTKQPNSSLFLKTTFPTHPKAHLSMGAKEGSG